MARIEFHKREVQTWFLDPQEDFQEKQFTFEVRKDDLTGHVSRILPFRRRKLSEKEISLWRDKTKRGDRVS